MGILTYLNKFLRDHFAVLQHSNGRDDPVPSHSGQTCKGQPPSGLSPRIQDVWVQSMLFCLGASPDLQHTEEEESVFQLPVQAMLCSCAVHVCCASYARFQSDARFVRFHSDSFECAINTGYIKCVSLSMCTDLLCK